MTIPVFDGHNDLLMRLNRDPDRRRAIWFGEDGSGHLDLPRMIAGGFAGGLFAMFVPSAATRPDAEAAMDMPPYDLPLGAFVAQPVALAAVMAMAGHLRWMERVSAGRLRICLSAGDVAACMAQDVIAAVMHLEGAEALDPDLLLLEPLYAMGLRSVGPVWSRPNVFGHGVQFRYPSSPDTGPGLTDAGRRLVVACNRLGILVDLSHLTEAGFDDVANLSDAPLVVTHSAAHAVTPLSRNLTDRQLGLIRDSGGIVGVNFSTVGLRRDGRRSAAMGWSPLLRHLDHLIAVLGEDHVGFGSDFDGATIPDAIGDVTGLPGLQAALRMRGYDTALLRKLCHGNWQDVLGRVWGG